MPTSTTKKPSVKPAAKKAAPKAATVKKPKAAAAKHIEAVIEHAEAPKPVQHTGAELTVAHGKYVYAVGRRKTSVANIRLFSGQGASKINNKEFSAYFGNNKGLVEQALKPLQLTGLEGVTYLYVNINGGGLNSQSQAIAHGISLAVAKSTPDFRKVLKKNGLLTRDSRMKERKKPGLKRARRGPQWAKR